MFINLHGLAFLAARSGTAEPIPGVYEAPAIDKSVTYEAAPRIPDQRAAPAAPALSIDVEASSTVDDAEAQALLEGRAPQLQHWIEVWALATSCIPHNNEANVKQTNNARIYLGVRNRLHKQVAAMSDVMRQEYRHALSAAKSIPLAVDSQTS